MESFKALGWEGLRRLALLSLLLSPLWITGHRSPPPRSCGLWAGGAAVPSGVRHLPLHPQDALCRHPKECLQGVAVYLCLHVLVYLVAQANMWSPDLCVCLTNEKCLQPGNCLGSLRNPPPPPAVGALLSCLGPDCPFFVVDFLQRSHQTGDAAFGVGGSAFIWTHLLLCTSIAVEFPGKLGSRVLHRLEFSYWDLFEHLSAMAIYPKIHFFFFASRKDVPFFESWVHTIYGYGDFYVGPCVSQVRSSSEPTPRREGVNGGFPC